ncbi:MAG: tetratricopeptide repeat protein [Candidatus Zixiibacteriota bacterium]|nr:MAG: tetratricopeptide repeat protein [candidate division Zixibacteria bacterium]
MDTIIIVFLLAVIALILIYLFYDRYKKEKRGKDPSRYIDGLKALLDGREELAFSKFRDVVAEDSGNIDAYIRIGDILRKYSKADKALQVHKDLTIRHDLTAREKKMILRSLADDFASLNDTESAAAALKELLSLEDSNRWAVEKLLELQSQSEDWEAAFETRERLLKLDGGKSKAGLAVYKFLQGLKPFNEKEYHKARVVFKEAVNLDSACTPAYLHIGDSYLAENRLDDAVSIWRKMVKMVPAESHLVLGRLKKALFDLGNFGEISTICNEILESSPKNLDARLTLADYHYKKGEYDIATEHLNTAIDEHPDSYIPVLDLARLYLSAGEQKKLADLIGKLEEQRDVIEHQYRCSRCGFKFRTKKWFCPSCKTVDSFVM